MKRFISVMMLLIVFTIFVSVVPASAAESAMTEVSVNKGDEVIYTLSLSDVPKKVVGCDFSVYFDSSEFKVKEYADFTGNYDPDEHQALINPNIPGEVRGNWSILSGIAFKNKRTFVSVKLEALKKADAHISYYVRYMYDGDLVQLTQYTFTCDVTVNKVAVIENAQPELNVDEEQSVGEFINSVTGDGKDADVNMADKKNNSSNGSNGGDKNENDVTSTPASSGSGSAPDTKSSQTGTGSQTSSDNGSAVGTGQDPDSTVEILDPASPDEVGSSGTSVWLWIVLAVIVIGGAAAVAVVLVKKKGNAE